MADFCKACSEEMFGAGHNDAEGLTSQADWERGLAALFVCEGCGIIQVDPEGNCVSPECLCQGQPGHGLPWPAMATADQAVSAPDPNCPTCGGCGIVGVDDNDGIPGAEPCVMDDTCPTCCPVK